VDLKKSDSLKLDVSKLVFTLNSRYLFVTQLPNLHSLRCVFPIAWIWPASCVSFIWSHWAWKYNWDRANIIM